MVTGAAGLSPSRLFHVTDNATGLCFLVDTGAEVSIIPPSRTDQKHIQDNLSLQAVNNMSIVTYSTRSLTLNLSRTFRWVFIIADVKKPILGADFLRTFGLLVDVKHCRLADAPTHLQVQGIACQETSLSPSLLPREHGNPSLSIVSEFPRSLPAINPSCMT